MDPAFETLKTASRADLIDAWREAIGRPAPKHISRSLLITVLSFEQQAKQYGRPNQRFRQALERHVSGKASKPKLHSGTRFIREHHGKTHIVEVDAAVKSVVRGVGTGRDSPKPYRAARLAA